jgi:hypothetical protein
LKESCFTFPFHNKKRNPVGFPFFLVSSLPFSFFSLFFDSKWGLGLVAIPSVERRQIFVAKIHHGSVGQEITKLGNQEHVLGSHYLPIKR